MQNHSHAEYERRMHKVLAHIDQHLDQALELRDLAEVAHFSAFHFHRLFLAWMGETLGDYLRRRRLEIAAVRLLAQPAVPVLQIALGVGFGSSEAFARAFKTRFGCSASTWREQAAQQRLTQKTTLSVNLENLNSNPDQVLRNLDQAAQSRFGHHAHSPQPKESTMQVKLIERQPTTITYLRHIGPYGPSVAAFWGMTVYPWLLTNNLLQAPRYGISHDDPCITAPEQCRYDAGVEVAANYQASGNAFVTTLPSGLYACADFKGTVFEIGDAWNNVLRDWLPNSGMQLDARPFFEYYPVDSSFDPVTGVFDCVICIPVTKL